MARSDHAQNHRLPVAVMPVAGRRFDRMADGVAVVEDGTAAALLLVAGDNRSLDGGVAGDQPVELFRVDLQVDDLFYVPFEELEEPGVGDDGVLDDLRHARDPLRDRQGPQRVGVGQHQARLVEGADRCSCRGRG